MSEFMTPPKHVNFRAKKLFGAVGNIVDGTVAYIDLNGGGPTELHTPDIQLSYDDYRKYNFSKDAELLFLIEKK